MITERQKNKLAEMSRVHTQKFERNGREISGKIMPMGENDAVLTSVGGGVGRNGNPYITLIFERESSYIQQLKTKVEWTPQYHFVFDYNGAQEVCIAFGHELKPKPEDMSFTVYFRHVYKRFKTFIGKDIQIVIGYIKEAKKDDYGDVVKRISYIEDSAAVEYVRSRIVAFNTTADWEVLYNMFFNE